MLSRMTLKHPEVYKQLIEYGKTICPHPFTSICVNRNFTCKPHKDARNVRVSTIVAIGDFTGCGLYIEGTFHNIQNNPLTFNGAEREHWTEDFEGDRISLVFFNVSVRQNSLKNKDKDNNHKGINMTSTSMTTTMPTKHLLRR